jgi:hypothetical protein
MECSTVVIPIVLLRLVKMAVAATRKRKGDEDEDGNNKTKEREKSQDAYRQQYTSNPNQNSSLPPEHKAYLNFSRLATASALMPYKIHSKQIRNSKSSASSRSTDAKRCTYLEGKL